MSIEAEDTDNQSTVNELLVEILNQLKIFNLYMAKGFDETLTEEDIEGDHDN